MGVKAKTAQDLFKSEREAWIDEARAAARRLLVARPYITIIDVLAVCPRPTYVHRNTTGHVFRHEDFKACGFMKSTSRAAKGRIICRWRLNHETMPLTMRQINRRYREAE